MTQVQVLKCASNGLNVRPRCNVHCPLALAEFNRYSVIITILHFAAGIHELNCGLVALGNGDVVLGANIPKRGNIELGGCDPAKALAKGVVRVDDIPMAGRVWHIHGTFGPIVVPLGYLDEGKCCKDKTKEGAQHGFLSILHNCITGWAWTWLPLFQALGVASGPVGIGAGNSGGVMDGPLGAFPCKRGMPRVQRVDWLEGFSLLLGVMAWGSWRR